jgi:uncharacterized protein YjiK
MQNMRFIYIIISSILFCSCYQKRVDVPSPPGYQLDRPHIINLPSYLDEISGLSYYAKDKSIFAESDEKGDLFKITPGEHTRITTWHFGKKKDYEDVILHDSIFYVLNSNGAFNVLKFTSGDSIISTMTDFNYGDHDEFEAAYYDGATKKIVMVCKDCEQDKKKSLTTYTFDPLTNSYSDSSYSIDIKALAAKMGEDKFRFKPSAAAINPLTGELFIISSINKLLLVLDTQHQLKAFYKLDPGLFKQPEGITFSSTGTMIISNESSGIGTANLLIYNHTNEK